jgi:hypothetical protein
MSRLRTLAAVAGVLLLGATQIASAQSVVFRAVADARPEVLVWVDTPETTTTDPDTKSFQDLFTNTTWLWLDNGVLLVRKGEELVASARYKALDNTNTFWALHNRREYTLDGSADRDLDDPTRGGATLYVTVAGDQNETITARVEVRLTFSQ